MPELTLESLARRLEEVERRLNEKQPSVIAATKDWRCVVGISEDNDFTRQMLAEIEAAHDAERQAALSEEAS
jgi:chromosome condensin MukBEF ATPase and DNA-binding subunit MukB